jgi:hypothetical protein
MPRDLANLLRKARGPCPAEDLLGSYSRGVLGPEAASVLRSHIELCGICQAWLKRMGDIERVVAERPSDDPGQDKGWNSAEKRLRRRIRAMTG